MKVSFKGIRRGNYDVRKKEEKTTKKEYSKTYRDIAKYL